MTYTPTTSFDEYLQEEQLKYPELRSEDIEALKESLADVSELPPISDKKYLAFLHSCYFDIELAKKTVKQCYEFYFDIPEIFCELDPYADCTEKSYNCSSVCFMPTANTDKGDRVLYIQFRDFNAQSFVYESLYKYLLMWMDYMLLTYGTCDGFIIVLNSVGLNWRHIMKLPFTVTLKMLKFLEIGLPIRLKTIHVINSGTATQMLLKLVQRFAKQELLEKIKVHAVGSEDVFNYVPRKSLPMEVGGLGKSHIHYNEKLYNNLKENCDIFYGQNKLLNNHITYMNQQLIENNE